MRGRGQRGAASVEQVSLLALVVLAACAAIGAVAAGSGESSRELGFSLARKLRCAAAGPGPCWRDPLTEAYGRSLAGAVRALAPAPRPLAGAGGAPALPVDFRLCRSAGCAAPGDGPGLTASNRRATVFSSVTRSAGGAEITYWEYRPARGWEFSTVLASAAEIAALAPTPLLETQVPAIVALETLAGANHFRFAAGEEPPWRWRIERR